MVSGLESRCVGRVYGADGALRPYAATENLMPLMMCVCTRNMSSFKGSGVVWRPEDGQ